MTPTELEEFPLDEPPEPHGYSPPPREGFPLGAAAGIVVLAVALIGGGAWFLLRRPAAPQPSPTPPPTTVAAASPSPSPIDLPSLEGSDALVRQLAAGLSPHPLLAALLSGKELIRGFAAAVVNVAEGESPAPHLMALAPKAAFRSVRRGRRSVVDPASYARYDAIADGFASLDPAKCAGVYRTLEPLLEAAYRELGHPEGGFSKALARANAVLLAVPVVEGEVEVRLDSKGLVWEYSERRLESLTPPQKHLLRMGPRNVEKVQSKLRDLAAALERPPA